MNIFLYYTYPSPHSYSVFVYKTHIDEFPTERKKRFSQLRSSSRLRKVKKEKKKQNGMNGLNSLRLETSEKCCGMFKFHFYHFKATIKSKTKTSRDCMMVLRRPIPRRSITIKFFFQFNWMASFCIAND